MDKRQMVERFLCPGCVAGSSTGCGQYRPGEYDACKSHVVGTAVGPGLLTFALGLPKGFNRPSPAHGPDGWRPGSVMTVRVWERGTRPGWDKFNIPVWALVLDGFLFVRTVLPRVGRVFTDVIEGGTLDLCPTAVNVGEFYDEID